MSGSKLAAVRIQSESYYIVPLKMEGSDGFHLSDQAFGGLKWDKLIICLLL